ncbi:MAG TPA: SpoIIE family protein phosphatase, partial [Acidimicrobiales bacterium]|nr:SpoIIE family protein phosphatase [Acidimicrobiales bacterium]
AAGLGTWRWDIASGRVEWDARLEALYGFEPGTFPGTFDAYQERIHPDDREQMLATVEAARQDRRPYKVEHRIMWPDGTVRWVQGSGTVTVGPDGEVNGALGCSLDVTELMEARLELAVAAGEAEAAAARERLHRQRLEFLGQVNDALAASGNRQEIMVNVSRAAVPRLGDWCLLYVVADRPGPPERVAAHADPDREAWASELGRDLTWDPDAPVGMPAVFRTGMPEFHPTVTPAELAALPLTDAQRELVEALGITSIISVPLVKRGRVIGGLQFVMAESGRTYDEDDLTLAESVAARVASALENRRLADQQQHIAATLQASLLPERLPDIPGLQAAVRYWAAGEATEVGGDFYDLFPVADGRWAACIGDVCGTGPVAASLTSMARNTLRLCAWRGDDPVTVLTWLNRAMLATRPGWFLTAAYLTVTPSEQGFDVEVTAAGHPLPIRVPADGPAELVGRPGTLLGAFEEVQLRPDCTRLAPGDTLVLYTDGICDVAPPHGLTEEQVTALVEQAVAEAGDAVDEVADRIHAALEAVVPLDDRNDDIALLVLRA